MTRDEALGESVGEVFAALSNEQSIAAFHRALRECGYAVVPLEPTQSMHDAARDWSQQKYGKAIGKDASDGCYRAMLEAVR